MTAFVDVTFRGLRVAHKAKLTTTDAGPFLEHETPLPVGSPLQVIEEGQPVRPARVTRVVEHEAGAGPAGMRLTWVSAEPAPILAPAPAAAAEPDAETAVIVDPAAATDASFDSSDDGSDRSSDGSVDRSSDSSVSGPVGTNGNGKKSKKNKKRR